MRLHTLWTHILDTPWTLRYFHRFSDAFLINIRLSQHSLVYFDFSTAISHVDRTVTATYYQSHRSMLHIYSILSTFSLSYHWRLRYFCLYHMAIDYSCDALLKQ